MLTAFLLSACRQTHEPRLYFLYSFFLLSYFVSALKHVEHVNHRQPCANIAVLREREKDSPNEFRANYIPPSFVIYVFFSVFSHHSWRLLLRPLGSMEFCFELMLHAVCRRTLMISTENCAHLCRLLFEELHMEQQQQQQQQ